MTSDGKGHLALARRLYLHARYGGNVREIDMAMLVQLIERRETEIETAMGRVAALDVLAKAADDYSNAYHGSLAGAMSSQAVERDRREALFAAIAGLRRVEASMRKAPPKAAPSPQSGDTD